MADGVWHLEERSGWKYRLLVGSGGLEGLVDVEVESPSSRRWVGTIGTLGAVEALMLSDVGTGECMGGAYFWTTDLLLLRTDDLGEAINGLEDLARSGELESCFTEATSDD